jgi:phosphoserine phosphatase
MVPLCVDLDGTLCRADTLGASALALLRRRPLAALLFPFWLLRGRAAFKRAIARRVAIDPARLPWNDAFVAWLRAEEARGREVWLVTAADLRVARAVAAWFGFFDGVIASDGRTNLKAHRKLQALAERFPAGFDYAGNSAPDLPIWRRARQAIVVNAAPRVLRLALQQARVALVFA